MNRIKKFIFTLLSAIAITIVILHFLGNKLENKFRHFYRDKICNCDTLRFREFNDSLSVPYINYYSISGEHIGIQRNPTSVCFAADRYFEANDKIHFSNCIDRLNQNSTTKDSSIFFEYKFNWVYDTKKPWRSAMAQGLALEAYTQAFQLFQDSIYLLKIDSILNSFAIEVDNGGITYKDAPNTWWYEEYACSLKPRVLNGMMYALNGLYYNYQITGNQKSQVLFEKGINSLKSNLEKYDNGNERSFYDIHKKVADEYYHQIHIDFLKEFFAITKDNTFQIYYNKWSAIKAKCYISKLITEPNRSSILLSISLFAIIFFTILILRKRK